MSDLASLAQVERFRSAVTQRLGLVFDDGKLNFLGEVLLRRLDDTRLSAEHYLNELERRPKSREIDALAGELTIGETYFFRNPEQFQALAELALPERIAARHGSGQPVRILSAGCATGEEAYSIAIIGRDRAVPGTEIVIRAIDLNQASLARAAAARYSPWALRDTPPAQRQRWFRAEGRELRLDENIRGSVRFERANLAEEDPVIWPPSFYDVIFCRNVLMYFSPERMRQIIDRFARALVPGGFLFLGHVETLRGVSDAFHLHHTHGTFYYQVKAGDLRLESAVPGALAAVPSPIDTPISGGWVETIQAASDRIARLIDAAPAAPVPDAPSPWDAAAVLDLVRRERFAEALDQLRQRPSAAAHDPDTLLLEAALLAQSGQLAAAEIAAKQLIGLDELSAGAHYVLALCREQSGNPAAAAEEHRIACYLDPAFAMPRLHLGLLARRAGDVAIARRELGQALILLKREDPSRLLMFGGGFGRDALVSLCRTALEDCGGQA